jgi:hypothetical protein
MAVPGVETQAKCSLRFSTQLIDGSYRCATVLVKGVVLLFGIILPIRYQIGLGVEYEWLTKTLEESLKSA